jgi:hypothetical protein
MKMCANGAWERAAARAVKSQINRHGVIGFLLYLVFGLLAVFICFAGLSPAGPMVQQDQVSRIRITAEIPFTYVSQIETDRRMEAVRRKVPPVFLLDLEPYRAFRTYLEQLFERPGRICPGSGKHAGRTGPAPGT